MSRWTLYGHPLSGHSYKVALALCLMGQTFEFRLVDLLEPRGARREDWRRDSRFGEAPVLLGEGGPPLAQSDAILLHLSDRLAPADWEAGRDCNAEWLFWEANRIGFSLPNYRLAVREGGVEAAVTAWLRARLVADLDRLDTELAGAAFLTGGRPAVADIACAAYLILDEGEVFDLEAWPAVRAWLDRIRALPGWRSPAALMSADAVIEP